MPTERPDIEPVTGETTGEMPMEDVDAAVAAAEAQETAALRPALEVSRASRDAVRMHRRIASRLLREGSPHRAFSELVRATRTIPMNGQLAAAIAGVAVQAGTVPAALAVLRDGVHDAEGLERVGVRRALARMLRRSDDLEGAREQLVFIIAEKRGDLRARFVLNALLEREERWDELDASLEKETREEAARGALRRASRSALRRARLWGERLGDPARAALRYAQAAQLASEAEDDESAFLLRLLWLRSLHQSQAPARALQDALDQTLEAGALVGREDAVRALARDLGLSGAPRATPPPKAGPVPAATGPAVRASAETTPLVAVVPDPSAGQTVTELPAVQAPPPAPVRAEVPRRRSTQVELMAVATEAEKRSPRRPEVAAVLAAAVSEGPDPVAVRRLEAHYVARKAWRELAGFYRECAGRAQGRAERTEWLEKLAELLESELHDTAGAERTWGELAQLTGDPHAVAERVRLAHARQDVSGARRALDDGVAQARTPQGRALALVARAEEALTRKDTAAARADFEAALKEHAGCAPAAAGLADLAALEGDTGPIRGFAQALHKVPRRQAGRAELYRRLARLAEDPLQDRALARSAWGEVLVELPEDEEALGRLPALARALGDDDALEKALRAQLVREPRGTRARAARLELVELLERAGQAAEALAEVRTAVRFEPGHREAWLVLVDRLSVLGKNSEVAWALEHAATATEEPAERMLLWIRLSRFCRDVLRDDVKADACDARVERMKKELRQDLPQGLLGGPLTVPQPAPQKASPRAARASPPPNPFDAAAQALGAARERGPARAPRPLPAFRLQSVPRPAAPIVQFRKPARAKPAADDEDWEGSTVQPKESGDVSVEEALSGEDDVVEVGTGDFEPPSDEVPVQAADLSRRTQELPPMLGDPRVEVPPSFSSWPASNRTAQEREALFERVRKHPLDPDGYKLLADHFEGASDPSRSSLMLEVALALEGDPHAAPRAPRLILSAADRAGLRHPSLRGEPGELLGLVGTALCRLYPARGPAAGTEEEFRLDSGKGARAAADALLAGVRILGLRSPDVHLSHDNGPPFALVYAGAPRVLVGKLAVKKELPGAELRFFAGRALFTQNPDLLALRSLRKEQIQKGLRFLGEVVRGRPNSLEARLVKDALSPKAFDRVRQLFDAQSERLELGTLAEAARHSANRAGLVVCGGVAPALASLRAKQALESEVLELVRFAASERYLAIRSRKLAR